MSYEETCKRAATDQGLDPLTAAVEARKQDLADAGVTYYVEQTGGFTMVATFYIGQSALTCTKDVGWTVVEQPAEVWQTGEWIEAKIVDHSGLDLTPEQIVDLALEIARR